MLADYVLALIRSDAPDDEIRQASIENLEDFLKESQLHRVQIFLSTKITSPYTNVEFFFF